MTALPNRSAVRAAFAAVLTAGLTGPGQLVQAVYGYTVKDFGAKMPVLVVGSGGTEQALRSMDIVPGYLLDLWTFVLYAEVTEDGTLVTMSNVPVWSEADSELALDAIEAAVRAVIDRNQSNGENWQAIDYAGASTADIIQVGDQSYRREHTLLRFKTY